MPEILANHARKWFKKYYLWAGLAATVILVAIILIMSFISGPEPVVYSAVKPYNVITGPPGELLNKPTAVAVGLRGELYIADSGNKRITVMEEDGRYALNFGGPGSGLAELDNPVSLAVAPNGNVYVADQEKQAVLVFNGGGGYLYTIADKQAGSFIPLTVKIDKKGSVYVFDAAAQKFRVYDSAGKQIKTFPANAIEKFENITALDLDPRDERAFGVNPGKRSYYEFRGNYLKTFGEDRLVNPQGIVYNRSKKVVMISDGYKNKIVVFARDGTYLGEFGRIGDGMGDFRNPAGLAFDERGKLYVADKDNNRVVIYTY